MTTRKLTIAKPAHSRGTGGVLAEAASLEGDGGSENVLDFYLSAAAQHPPPDVLSNVSQASS